MKHHSGVADLAGLLQSHENIMEKVMAQFMSPSRATLPCHFKSRELCKVKSPGSKSWTSYSILEGEQKFVKDHPNWETDLVKCPPGELYSNQLMKEYDRAHDLEKKYSGKPSQKWNQTCHESSRQYKEDAKAYEKRIGDMGEHLVKIAMES